MYLILLSIFILNSASLNIGLGYPYLSLRSSFSNFAFEVRYSGNEEIDITGFRVYQILKNKEELKLYLSSELNHIQFKNTITEGSGYSMGIFAGGEYYIFKNISFIIDLGPVLIAIRDDNYNVSAQSIEFVVNTGLNLYFWHSKRKTMDKKELMRKHYMKGIEFMKRKEYEKALKEFEEVLKYEPNHKPSLIRIKKIKNLLKE
ncbi:MAG: hypothetical protein DRI36_04790 [Caldiserica bacterium]|nr:MAG: hypothetical protein DRI36_04790 [Caldisericota bacterium]